MDGRSRKREKNQEPQKRGSLRLWISLAVVFLILFVAALGQWDWALAGLMGLLVGNGLGTLFSGR